MQNLFSSALQLNQSISTPTNEKQEIVPWKTLGIPFGKIYTARNVPTQEKSFKKTVGSWLIYYLGKCLPLNTPGLPQIPEDTEDLMTLSYPQEFRQLFPAPQCPLQIINNKDDLIGALALAGPFAEYIRSTIDDGIYTIDLRNYQKYSPKDGLMRLGGRAFMAYDESLQRMKTSRIEYLDEQGKAQVSVSKDANWNTAQKILRATLQTDITAVRHLIRSHLMVAGTFSAVNNNTLAANHPLRRLMHPHQFMTISTNDLQLKLLLGNETSFVPSVYSYDLPTFGKICADIEKELQIKDLDAKEDFKQRGMIDTKFHYPYRENALSLWKIIETYVGNYINNYYEDDTNLQNCKQLQKWYKDLNTYIPNGILNYVTDDLTKENVKKLITLFIYTVSVGHAQTGSITFNYLGWLQYLPTNVRADGKGSSIGLHQVAMHVLFGTNASSPKLTDDFSNFAVDEKGKKCMQQFIQNLLDYQRKLDDEGIHPYTLCPKNLETSVSS